MGRGSAAGAVLRLGVAPPAAAGASAARPPAGDAPCPPAQVAVVELPFAFVSSETEGGAGGTCVIRGCVPKKLLVYA